MEITIAGKKFEMSMEEIPIKKLVPDFKQPRRYEIAKREDKEIADKPEDIEKSTRFIQLVRSVLENKGISVPLIVEKTPEDGYKLIEGDRRLGAANYILNSKEILENFTEAKNFLSKIPCMVIKGPLKDEERLTILAHLHVQHVSWKPTGKNKVIEDLLNVIDDDEIVSNIMGVTKGNISKLRRIEELAKEIFSSKKTASISYATEFSNIKRSLIDDEVKEATKSKIENEIITSPVQLRELRDILESTEARKEYLKPETTIEGALKVAEAEKIFRESSVGLDNLLQQFLLRLKAVSLDELMKYKDNEEIKKKVEDTRELREKFEKYL